MISNKQNNNNTNRFTLFWKQLPNGSSALLSENPALEVETNHHSWSSQSQDTKQILSWEKESPNSIKNLPSLYDCSDKLQKDMIVMTEWGPGKIISIDKPNQTCKIKIESQELSFPISLLNTSLNIKVCIINNSQTTWGVIKLSFGDNAYSIKSKIGKIMNVHASSVLIIHHGEIITNNNISVFDIGWYDSDEFLAVIQDPIEFSFIRFKGFKKREITSPYNNILWKVDNDIIWTGLGLFKNLCEDITYSVWVRDDAGNVLYKGADIWVKRASIELQNLEKNAFTEVMAKYVFDTEIVLLKDRVYEIEQIISKGDEKGIWGYKWKNQMIGYQQADSGESEKNKIKICFMDSPFKNKINTGENCSSVGWGMIPAIFYKFLMGTKMKEKNKGN